MAAHGTPRRLRPLTLAGAIAAALWHNAAADDRLDAISVTATRSERSLFDTPDTVTHIDQQEIERDQAQKLSDVFKGVPGVSFGGGPRAVAEQPNIRGMSGNRILITIDGARQNFDSGHKGRVFVEPELLKAVDVLRGPGSAVYGSGAMGGVIAMTTKDAADFLEPGQKFGVRLKAGYQDVNHDRFGTGIAFGAFDAIGGGDYLLSVTRNVTDDIRLGGGETLDDSAESAWAGLAKLNWTPGDSQRFTLSRQYTFDSGEVPAQANQETSATAVLTDRETEVTLDRLGYRYSNPNNTWLDLDAFVYNNAQTIREKRIGTDGRLDVIDFDTRGIDVHNATVFGAGVHMRQRFSYGVEYYRDRMNGSRGGAANDAFPDANADFYGAYLQDEISLRNTALGSWELIPGLRLDSYESQADHPISGVADSTSERQLSPKLGVIYKAASWLNLSFNYGQAFRAPSFQELYVSGVHFGANEFQPNPDLKPERLTSGLELGVRMRGDSLLESNDRAELRASVYHNEYKDFIESVVTASSTRFENVSRARIQGAELEASYYSASLDLDTNVAVSVSTGEDTETNQPLDSIPGNSLTLTLQKYLPEHGMSLGWRSAFHQRQDRINDNIIGNQPTPGYTVSDVWLTWLPAVEKLDDLQVIAGIDNLFDKRYTPHLSELPAPGRNVKVSVILQF